MGQRSGPGRRRLPSADAEAGNAVQSLVEADGGLAVVGLIVVVRSSVRS